MASITRRTLLAALAGATTTPATPDCEQAKGPDGWCSRIFQGRKVFSRGSGPPIVLLHEMNGLSPGCVDFGMELAGSRFTVHIPLLFGHPLQNNVVFGAIQACLG